MLTILQNHCWVSLRARIGRIEKRRVPAQILVAYHINFHGIVTVLHVNALTQLNGEQPSFNKHLCHVTMNSCSRNNFHNDEKSCKLDLMSLAIIEKCYILFQIKLLTEHKYKLN